MKFYLSSYKIGDFPNKLKALLPQNSKAVYICNALDFSLQKERLQQHIKNDIQQISDLGVQVDSLDLRDYFGKKDKLKKRLDMVDLFYISGGNTFDLRRAMQLSGFDELLFHYLKTDKVYGGYSAAVCVLSPTLKGYDIVDDPHLKTYGEYETMWEGLAIIDWQFAPHFDSDHPESMDIEKEIAYCKEKGLPYRALRDGEVIITEIKKKLE